MRSLTTQEALFGREELVADILATVLSDDGHGSLLVGDVGLGKTSVAAAVLELGGSRIRPFHAFGSSALASEPYGVLAPFLTGLHDGRAFSSSDVLRALSSALRTGTDERAVLVIEDAQFLDDSSAVLLAQLAAANQARFILLCAPFPSVPAELWSMCSDGLLKSFELAPLPQTTMQELCRHILGHQVFPSASVTLCRRASGNPMFLVEQIKHARRTGTLVEHNGVWQLIGELTGSTKHVREVVRYHLLQLSEAQRQALDYVALAGSLDLDTLRQVASSSTVDDLEESKLIVVSNDPVRVVSLAVPPMGEVMCELLPAAKTMAMRRTLLPLLDLSAARPETLIRCIGWALEDGFQVPDINILRAAQLANRLDLPDLAEQAAAAVTSSGLSEFARLEQARTMTVRGEYPELQELASEMMATSSDPEMVRLVASLCGHGGLRPGLDGTFLETIASDWREAVDRLAREGSLKGQQLVAEHATSMRLMEIQGMHGDGNYHGTEDELARIFATSENCAPNLLVSCTLLSEVFSATGRAVKARELSSRAADLLESDLEEMAYYREFVLRRHLLALWHAGEFSLLREVVDHDAEHNVASLPRYGGSYQLAKGLCDLAQGGMNVALQTLVQAVEALQYRDPGNDLPQSLAAAAYAAAVLGRESVKEYYAKLYEATGPGRDAASSLRSQAFLLAANGMFEGNPRPKLRLVADEAAALGMVHVEMDVLMLGIHAGDLGLALRLKAVASRCEGRHAQITAEYAKALSEKDPMALLAFSDAAESEGRELDAARSAGNAVAILSRRGDRNRLHSAQRVAKRRLATLVHGHDPLSARLSTAPQLTRRERKVAALVHGGASNRDIAAEFGLSLRTVEGHLYRIFAKLGISDRSEIANTTSDSWNV
ncbi:regulatory protein, luxR family [Arthrobacter alpinus]|uniref:Regulatory protein, luxR family n=1 Tax=Arthrobacter alpinus TaxID=656366 RepID=A0A1H5KLJ1_9MICC|nr:LuxR C-terminal-related transcriptional regulator [Arthrobacter alpinus]SEE64858.1 regulatory protein, luxR family [Arthrobacter alpinus]